MENTALNKTLMGWVLVMMLSLGACQEFKLANQLYFEIENPDTDLVRNITLKNFNVDDLENIRILEIQINDGLINDYEKIVGVQSINLQLGDAVTINQPGQIRVKAEDSQNRQYTVTLILP
ncbi:MAG: hypothetical protein HC913_15995 [Microscillaceae bacterium]|nr:hypothetical protein [Microscillaceae bacterium]